MKKTLLLAGVACLFAAQAQAVELNPYVSLKGAFVDMENKANIDSAYTTPSNKIINNKIVDKGLSDNTWGVRAAYGVSTPLSYGGLRGEFELGWNDDASKSGSSAFKIKTPVDINYNVETSIYSAMANVYYDLDTGTNFTPYVGAGLGYARVESTASVGEVGLKQKSSADNLAWNVGLGVAYKVSDNLSLDAGYRYTDYGNVKDSYSKAATGFVGNFDVDSKSSITSQEFLVGARYSF